MPILSGYLQETKYIKQRMHASTPAGLVRWLGFLLFSHHAALFRLIETGLISMSHGQSVPVWPE